MSQFHHNFITTVIDLYGLELGTDRVDTIVDSWLQKYDSSWIVKAIVESVYRGRYKIKSVDNILKDWQRLGTPRCNFTPEYEREILKNLPDINSVAASTPTELANGRATGETVGDGVAVSVEPELLFFNTEDLDPEESAPFQYRDLAYMLPSDRSSTQQTDLGEPTAANIDRVRNLDRQRSPSISDSDTSAIILHPPGGKICRHIPQPVNFQLFHTLKAIVDPNNQQSLPIPISLGEIVNR
jgi:hypothetical protein